MKQFALLNFMEEVNGHMVRVVVEPGTSWEDVFSGIDSIKSKMLIAKEDAELRQKEEDEKKVQEDSPEVAELEVSA